MIATKSRETPDWLSYERCAAAFAVENCGGIEATVVPNAQLVGVISGKKRQIDVLVDAQWSRSAETRILFEARHKKRKLTISDVEGFEGMMRDCNAQRGILLNPVGWTSGVESRAGEAVSITLLNLEDLDDFEFGFEPCLDVECQVSNEEDKRGAVLWEEFLPSGFGAGWVIIQVGKCDRCRSCHLWCWDCGSKFSVPDGHVIQCGCEEREWASDLSLRSLGMAANRPPSGSWRASTPEIPSHSIENPYDELETICVPMPSVPSPAGTASGSCRPTPRFHSKQLLRFANTLAGDES